MQTTKGTYYTQLLEHSRNNHDESVLHMHYGSTRTIDDVAQTIGLYQTSPDKPFYLLDIGSGFGAPARYMAKCFPNVHIDCVEIDKTLHEHAIQYTQHESMDVQKRIRHIHSDITIFLKKKSTKSKHLSRRKHKLSAKRLRTNLHTIIKNQPRKYHGVLCMMTLLHMTLQQCKHTLQLCVPYMHHNAKLVIEDFYCKPFLSELKQTRLAKELCMLFGICNHHIATRTHKSFMNCILPMKPLYISKNTNISLQTKQFVLQRSQAFPHTHAESTWNALIAVYNTIATLYSEDVLDVYRIELIKSNHRTSRSLQSYIQAVTLHDVPRSLFLPSTHSNHAHIDRPLPIDAHQTISAPHIHDMTLNTLRKTLQTITQRYPHQKTLHVLDVGCGSGYIVALMCHVLDIWLREYAPKSITHVTVTGIDIIDRLVNFSIRNIESWLHSRNSPLHKKLTYSCHVGNGWKGCATHAPYAFINVGAMADRMPEILVEQLQPRGMLLVPVNGDYIVLTKASRRNITNTVEKLTDVRFVPLVHC